MKPEQKSFVLALCALIFSLIVLSTQSHAQTQIAYHIGWQQPNTHYFHISMAIENPEGKIVDFRIPDWRPGRYMVQHFAKNVVQFRAVDGTGKALKFRKIDKVTWRVETGGAKQVTAKYKYYARQLDAGASFLDDAEAYFNPITCFMYVPDKEMLPVTLKIDKPADWRVATAMEYDEKREVFFIGNYHDFADSPFLISPSFKLLSFEYKGATFELAFQGEADFDEEKVVEDVRKIVVDQVDMMQDTPFERYLFMYHLLPYRFGHGVEHKNSTSIVTGPADFDNERFYRRFLGVTSHEFFHAWNVERIRPQGIFHPDYSQPNFTTLLWVSEGMTSYYGGLSLMRAGLTKKDRYLSGWARTIQSYKNNPGYGVSTVSEVSWESWSRSFGAPPNTSYSFYSMGNILGMLLDLEIRHLTENKKSLDDVFRYLNKQYAQKDRGVPDGDFLKAINKVSGKNFNDFFAKYVDGTEAIDWNKYLNYAGLQLEEKKSKDAPAVYFGLRTRGDDKQTTIANVTPDSPAARAGLDQDDILVAIDGRRAHRQNLNALLKKYQPGDTIKVTVLRREHLRDFEVELAEAKNDDFKIVEIEEPAELQAEILKSWLNLKEEEAEATEEKGGEK
jgi:predicted metalloprotease with PDZ domain